MSEFPEVKDHLVANPDKYTMTTNPDGTVTLRPTWVDNPSEVLQEGTPVDAAFLSKIPEAIDAIDTKVTTQLAETANRLMGVYDSAPYGMKSVAHRGMSFLAPENTLPAYEIAGKLGYWGFETDLLVTSDGAWVLMHDDTVDRTTDGTGLVKDKTLAQIKSLRVDTLSNVAQYPNLRVPTLEEFLVVCKKWGGVPVIEIKAVNNESDYDTLVDIISKMGFEKQAIIISSFTPQLQAVSDRNKNIALGWVQNISASSIATVKALGTNVALFPDHNTVTKSLVESAHAENVAVGTWTVNTFQKRKLMVDAGVDMLISDKIRG